MSLINQMLRDLEQRRSAEAGPAPLGGLSSSGSVAQSVNFSINYRTLTALVSVLFVAGVAVAYLLGSQQYAVENTSAVVTPVESDFVGSVGKTMQDVVLPKLISVTQTPPPKEIEKLNSKPVAITPVSRVNIEQVQVMDVEEPMVVKTAVPLVIKSVAEGKSKEPAADVEQNINKTIRPLTAEQQSQIAFQRAIRLLGRGNQAAAQLALEEALQIANNHIRARETLAALLLNDGRVSEAASSLRNGLQLMPDATPLAKIYARILVDQGDVAIAISVLERARPAVSADPEYHALLAALYRQEKKYSQAVLTYQQILLQRPAVAAYWMGLGLSQDAMGEGAQALNAFQRAQRAGGLNAQVLRYIQSRIEILTPAIPVETNSAYNTSNDADEFEE